MNRRTILTLVAGASLFACNTGESHKDEIPAPRTAAVASSTPFDGLVACDELLRPGEKHLAHLWRLSRGVLNAAEGYWSHAGDRIVYQATPDGVACDRIFVTEPRASSPKQLSNGRGVTTCAYFLPGDTSILYASTHAFQQDCPPPPDRSAGYVWSVYPEYDIYVHDLSSGRETALTSEYGYDAEATVSPKGDRMVFTSTRSGDLELWTCKLDGTDMKQVTHEPGYDGGAFFSHDGQWLVYRSTMFTPGKEAAEQADYQKLLSEWKVRPTRMEIMVSRVDGSERKRVTDLGKANWAPFFFPGDERIVFATNHHDDKKGMPNFDLFAIDVDGRDLEQITFEPDFDAFPVFSPDGRWLCFASNRGATKPGETNLFVAEWR